MGFLKVVTSIAIAVFLLIFLNNFMAMIFPTDSGTSGYYSGSSDESYKQCESLQPNYNQNVDYNSDEVKTAQDAYSKCMEEKTRETNDKKALAGQYIWLRAIIALLILVGISIALFKKFPFYGGALIGGGLLFAVTYPIFAQTGFSFDFMFGSNDVSASVKAQTQLIKMITSLLGLSGLTAADLFFFEKHHDNKALPINNNFASDQNIQHNIPQKSVDPDSVINEPDRGPEDTKNNG